MFSIHSLLALAEGSRLDSLFQNIPPRLPHFRAGKATNVWKQPALALQAMLGSVPPFHARETWLTYKTGFESFIVLSTSKPPNFHSPLGEVNIEDGRKLPCVLAPDVFMNLRADCCVRL